MKQDREISSDELEGNTVLVWMAQEGHSKGVMNHGYGMIHMNIWEESMPIRGNMCEGF